MPTTCTITTLVDGPGKITLMITAQGAGALIDQVIYTGTPAINIRRIRYLQSAATNEHAHLTYKGSTDVVSFSTPIMRGPVVNLDFSSIGGLKNFAPDATGILTMTTSSFGAASDTFTMILEIGK